VNDQPLRWYHRLYVGMQYVLPQHALSALVYRITRSRWRPFKDILIRVFIRLFRVDMEQALERDPGAYPTFNAFFTRPLRPGTRPPAPERDAVLSAADGTLSQAGPIVEGRLFQAKGHEFSLEELIGDCPGWAARFQGGTFYTVYLSPRDYHRVHMPLTGTLSAMVYVPGRLFSVNAVTTRLVPGLFARNERVVCLFEGDAGPMAVILVGAIFVGSIETVWAGQVTPRAEHIPANHYAGAQRIRLGKGEEMGRFNMGSTVILLFPPGAVEQQTALAPGHPVQTGQRIGTLTTVVTSPGRGSAEAERTVSA
jgi:phosphatidylserine decarboxylase